MKVGSFPLTVLLLVFLTVTACHESGTLAEQKPLPPAEASPTAVTVDQSDLYSRWQQSPHAQTYDIAKGPNTYCSRCHAPRNWDPEAVIDPPPNCVSCKFEFEDEPRLAAGNPLVPREEWLDIRCDICHEVTEGLANPELVWWDQAAAQYVPVATSTALCEKCHTDTETLRHRREVGDEAHPNFQCTDCHDAHSTVAGCSDSDCHAELSPEFHQPTSTETTQASDHVAVICVACHDASGLEVGPLESAGIWVTWRTTEFMGVQTAEPYQSHDLTLTVDCQRCHFQGNPWNLEMVDAQYPPP